MNTLQKYEKYLYLIFLIGIVIYFPIFFNGFVWDDHSFIIDNPQVHQVNLSLLFGSNDFNSGPFYRPIPAVYFAIVYSLFGKTAFFYHLIQLVLHLIGTFLLFIFFCTFFTEEIAFFLALGFLIHPINVESVAYIGSTQSELYFIPGISALLLAQKKHLSQRRLYVIVFLLTLSVFTKEVGFLFILLLLSYRAIFKLGDLKRFSFFVGIITIFYISMRVFYGGVTYAMTSYIPIAALPFSQRLLNIPAIILYYLKTFLFPLNLLIWQFWVVKTINWTNFFLPLLCCILIFIGALYIGYLLSKQEKKQTKDKRLSFKAYLFFFIWFVIGISMLLQIVPLDMTVADRWFYFPIVGLLGMIGVGLTFLLSSYKIHRRQYLWIVAIVLFILAARTCIRSFDYRNDLTLYGHDIHANNINALLLTAYGEDLFIAGKRDEGCRFIQRATTLSQSAGDMNELGNCYQEKQQYDEAITAYTRALQILKSEQWHNGSPVVIYINMAHVLILADRPQDSIDFINNEALKKYPGNQYLLQLLSMAKSELTADQNFLQNFQNPTPIIPNLPMQESRSNP